MDGIEAKHLERLARILALAEHDEDDDAIAAFLLARSLMAKRDIQFSTLVRSVDALPDAISSTAYVRLIKILSLTTSDKEGESIAAFLMARRLMARMSLTFTSILTIGPAQTENGPVASAFYETVDIEIMSLRNKVDHLSRELAKKSQTLARYETALETMIDTAWTSHHEQPGLIGTEHTAH